MGTAGTEVEPPIHSQGMSQSPFSPGVLQPHPLPIPPFHTRRLIFFLGLGAGCLG